MVIVDHPADVDVYSTMVEEYLNPEFMGNIYTVSKTPKHPSLLSTRKAKTYCPKSPK